MRDKFGRYVKGERPESKESYEKAVRTRRKTAKEKGYWLSKETRKKISLAHKGKSKPWLRGRTHSEGHKIKIGLANAISKLGTKLSKESIIKRTKTRKQNGWNKNSLKTKQKHIEARAKQILPVKDTTIEVKIQNFLKQLGIEYFTHQYMKIEHGYQCDILIPSMNLVIECDGNYWHKYPIGTEIDIIRTRELLDKGFRVLRFWESEIRVMELNDFENKLCISIKGGRR